MLDDSWEADCALSMDGSSLVVGVLHSATDYALVPFLGLVLLRGLHVVNPNHRSTDDCRCWQVRCINIEIVERAG